MTWTDDVDVSTSAGLAAALDAVEASPGVWDSPLGHQVAKEIVRLLPRKVGPARLAELVSTGSAGRDEVVADLAASVVEMLLMRRDLRSAAGGDLWAVLATRAVWMVQGHQERDRQQGLCGDSAHPHRMRERVSCTALDVADIAAGTGFTAPGSVETGRRTWVRDEDLGPCLEGVVDALVWASVPIGIARAGTCRVAELAASTHARERHRSARQDAGDGVLASLGVSPCAAGAWMSLVAGSRRGGLESALVWSLRERIAEGLGAGDLVWGEFLSASQLRWLKTVVAGVVVQAPVAPVPVRRAPVRRLDEPGVQLTLFPVEEVGAGAAA